MSFRLFSGPHELFATENLTLLFTTTTKNPEIDTLNCKRLVKQSYGKRRMIIHNSILIKKAPKRHFFLSAMIVCVATEYISLTYNTWDIYKITKPDSSNI